jgi:hypothetical protein
MKRSPLNKVGKRTKHRWSINARLKHLWEELGITSCELRLPGCVGTFAMGAAHSKKSRFLITDADWMHACLACTHCHQLIEAWPHDQMFKVVSDAIDRRESGLPVAAKNDNP